MSSPTNTRSAVGVDFGGTSIKLGVCRGASLLETDEPIPTQGHDGPAALIRVIADRVANLRKKHPDIAAVGVGVPGLVDFDRGFVHILTNLTACLYRPELSTQRRYTKDASCRRKLFFPS